MKRTVALTVAMLAATPVLAEQIDGSYENTLQTLYAVTMQGSRAPEGDPYCNDMFGKFVGSAISGDYQINTETLIMSATANYEGTETPLNPLGIAGVYAFMGFPEALKGIGVNRIMFNLALDQSTKESDVLFLGNDQYNCVLSSMDAN
ncbi:MAG: hypothetical protein Q8Q62_09040 [Mesorhizobium sp.]|nr:hypothetical protein [Mesorhizobium sp.]